MAIVSVTASAGVEEFYNSNHSKTDGRFAGGGGGKSAGSYVGRGKKGANTNGALDQLMRKHKIGRVADNHGTVRSTSISRKVKVKQDWHNANHALNEKIGSKTKKKVIRQVKQAKKAGDKANEPYGKKK